MSRDLAHRLFHELEQLPLIDPHSHINPHAAASKTLADILGYHYYTELAHSAGLPKERIEEPGISPKEKVGRLIEKLGDIDNTVQLSWFLDLAKTFFGFEDDRLTLQNWERLYDHAEKKMAQPDWEEQVLKISKLEAVFLTNDFDDPLTGFDTKRYIPCLRTDDLVFHFDEPATRERFAKATGIEPTNAATIRAGIRKLFEHFVAKGAKACAISLPPSFTPEAVSNAAFDSFGYTSTFRDAHRLQTEEGKHVEGGEATTPYVQKFMFWTIAEFCAEFKLPFDLMIGVNRGVYPHGVYQGQDLFDHRVSLIQYKDLFNAFPTVTFPISVLGQTSNQELISYAWIFPNIVTHGSWWYSNIPSYIELDTRSRLEVVPRTKQIGYYSDMYKLEFGLPKFRMYRRILAKVLAEDFVIGRGWLESRAIELGKTILRGNVERIFGV